MGVTNRKTLKSNVKLLIDNITFLPESGVEWEITDNVVFSGTLEEALVLGLKNFAVFTTLIQETYSLVWDRNWQDVAGYSITPITLLGEIHVIPEQVALVSIVTNGYRASMGDTAAIILEEIADPTNKLFYSGSRGAILAYLLQVQDAGTDRIYDLYNFSLMNSAKDVVMGFTFDDILGVNGPVEIEEAHQTLANAIALARVIR